MSEQLQLEDEGIPIILRRAWDRALRMLATRVNKPTFEGHIRTLRPLTMIEETERGVTVCVVTLGVPSVFTREWVEKRNSPLIQSVLEEILDRDVRVRLSLLPRESASRPATASLFDDSPPGAPGAAASSDPLPRSPRPRTELSRDEVPLELFRSASSTPSPPTSEESAPEENRQSAPPRPDRLRPDQAHPDQQVRENAGLTRPGERFAERPAPPRSGREVGPPSSMPPAARTTSSGPSGGRGGHADAPALNSRYTFDAFVVGSNNRLAHAGACAVAQAPAQVYNPLFLYGSPGLGKTHLMHAIGHEIARRSGGDRVAFISGEAFTSSFISSLREQRTDEFRRRWRSVDVLLIDDIQFIAGKESTKEEFFHTFNTLYQTGKQIVITSDRSPRELRLMDERLRSRFECGLIADIAPPDLETRLAILHKKAEAERMRIPDDVLLYMARLVQSNIRTLEGALVKLIAYASLVGSPVTTQLASDILERYYISAGADRPRAGGAKGEAESKGPEGMSERMAGGDFVRSRITAEMVQRVVLRRFNLSADALLGKRRDKEVAHARQIAMHLMRELTETSLPGIGQFFGGRDHSTVSHACERIRSLLPFDDDLRELVDELMLQVRAQASGE